MPRRGLIDRHPFPGRLAPIYDFFAVIPPIVREKDYWFYNVSNLAYMLIAILHTSWIVVFYNIGAPVLALAQFASVFLYTVAIVANRRGMHIIAMVIALAEANAHQMLSVSLLGWNAGFQNFIPLMAILPFLNYNTSWFNRLVFCLVCVATYLYLDFFMKDVPPAVTISNSAQNLLNFSNAVLCFFLAALWGIVLALSYQRTVATLMSKEQELFRAEKKAEQQEILSQLAMKERDNEIFQLRNVELKESNEEIAMQKKTIEDLVHKQEKIIEQRTEELADSNMKLTHANLKLLELIRYNAHNLREPLVRVTGAMSIKEYMSEEEFYTEIWPQMSKALNDLDNSIKDVIKVAGETVKNYSQPL